MNEEIRLRFASGIKKFNDKDFYASHDILEDVWFDTLGSDKSFYQGLIHLAVGFYHITEKKNSKGALLQLRKGIAKLTPFKPAYEGVELSKLLGKIEKCINEIERLKDGKIEKLEIKLIPKITFRNS
jgi:predicted metal-dependent hydrolase